MLYPKLRQRKRRTNKQRFSPKPERNENEFGARKRRQEDQHSVRPADIDNLAHQIGPGNERHVDDAQGTEHAGGNRDKDGQPALLRDACPPADRR